MPGKNYQGFRFSGLTEITPDNVKHLKVAWTFSTGVEKGQEAAPLVVGNTMYVVTPFPNILYALDLTKPGAPLKWKLRAEAGRGGAGRRLLRRGQPRRRLRRRQDLLQHARRPHRRASTPQTGKEVWRTKLGDINERRDDDDGAAGGQGQGAGRQQRRRVRRARLADGARREHRQDRLARLQHRPRQGRADRRRASSRSTRRTSGKDLGVNDLAARGLEDRRRHRVGLDLLRPGARPDLLRHRQPRPVEPRAAPGRQQVDRRDLRARPGHRRGALVLPVEPARPVRLRRRQRERRCVDLAIGGTQRKVLVHPDRNGYIYVLDRTTGEVLSAKPFVYITSTTGRRPEDRPAAIRRRTSRPRPATVVRDICPASPGAKDWQPSAFSPRPACSTSRTRTCARTPSTPRSATSPGTPYVGADVKMYAGPGRQPRRVHGLGFPVAAQACGASRKSSRSGAARWPPPATSSSTARWTAGSRRSTRRPATSCGSSRPAPGSSASRSIYRGPDGKQYVAVLSGRRRLGRRDRVGDLDPRDGTAALGFVNAMKDLPQDTSKGGTLYVFALP